jgi:ribosome-binding factor A
MSRTNSYLKCKIGSDVARKINLRTCPEFHFSIDDGLEYAEKMDKLFAKISNEGNNDL